MISDSSGENQPFDDLESTKNSRPNGSFQHRRYGLSWITGIPVANLSEAETVTAIDDLILEGGTHYAAVVNAAKVVAANHNEALRRVLVQADIVTADGMSVVWASRVLGQGLKQRVTGIDLFECLVDHAAATGLSVYFLGARDESVRGTVELLAKRHPSLRVAGYRNGYFAQSESTAVAEAIKRSGADLLFVGMGSPKQEFWIASNLARTGVRFAMGVGGSFDHVSGLMARAPLLMQRLGLEWLYRLTHERRLWRRYLIGNPAFIWLIVRQFFRYENGSSKSE
ncbi:MAG TPA: WecB/TagA/CpsF family glycosyltransferase [Blastocatellia bacterium]|nr:WecB/TagA/CpsF family glycosyltransferase [Blastocatellia bacterium]